MKGRNSPYHDGDGPDHAGVLNGAHVDDRCLRVKNNAAVRKRVN